MKIRHPYLIRTLALFAAWLVRWWMGTLQLRIHSAGGLAHPVEASKQRYLYSFWHETLLFPFMVRLPRMQVLISQHADGELIARVCQHLGQGVVRGSSTRGGAGALRQLLKEGRRHHLIVTPDGPRGPRRQVQKGLAFLASHTGLAIVPLGVACDKGWRLRTWDRFLVPRPWGTAYLLFGTPFLVPPRVGREALEAYRERLERHSREVTRLAERWAAAGSRRPPREVLAELEGSAAA